MDNPDITWRQCDHQFNDLPAHVKGYVRKQLKVPTTHSENLLPLPRMSVLDLVHMNLPPISSGQDAYSNIPCTFSFFSPTHPINDIEFLNRSLFHLKALLPNFLTKQSSAGLMAQNPLPFQEFPITCPFGPFTSGVISTS